jgi:hypothetical protein
MGRLVLLAICILFLGSTCPPREVVVVNGTDKPVPTAPMGESVSDGQGGLRHNPGLGPIPSKPWLTPTGMSGWSWLEIGLGIASVLGIPAAGAAALALRRAKDAMGSVVDAVEALPPETAEPVKRAIARKTADQPAFARFVKRRTKKG